jgi:ribosomal protein S18 acetylase RimI-like enzyme
MLREKTSNNPSPTTVEASPALYAQLADFLNQNIQTHRHLDWFSSLDWVGHHPYLIEMDGDDIQAALCTAPENADAAWIRLYAVCKTIDAEIPWNRLLPQAIERLRKDGVKQLAALAIHPWFETLLEDYGFRNRQNVVVMEWQGDFPKRKNLNNDIILRPMHKDDLQAVMAIDHAAFPPLWQNSLEGLSKAFGQTGISTVALLNDEIVGYQISTTMTIYGHLARLAVAPGHQRKGIAFTLVHDLLKQFERLGFWRITVNTQSDNSSSAKLYQGLKFRRTGEEIRVFELGL